MGNRLALDAIFKGITKNTYYQAPSNITMNYPAIKYDMDDIKNTHADDEVYSQHTGYSVTVIDPDADSDVVDKVSKLPMCRFDRAYTADNLYHKVFTIYY